jgi:hypothetical protein
MGLLVKNWESQNQHCMDEKPLLHEITKLVSECEKLGSFRPTMMNNFVWIANKVAIYDVEFDISGGRSPNKGSKKTRLDEPYEDLMVRIYSFSYCLLLRSIFSVYLKVIFFDTTTFVTFER